MSFLYALPLLLNALGALTAPSGLGDHLADLAGHAALSAAPANAVRVEVLAHRERIDLGCRVESARALGAVLGSGRLTLQLDGVGPGGASCRGWSWVMVRVFAQTLATIATVGMGEPLADRTVTREVELLPGRHYLQELPDQAVAALQLAAGASLETQSVRSPAQIPGRELRVRLRSGDLAIETRGQSVPCSLDAVCARLPSGKQISGTYTDGYLEVLLP